MNAKIFALVLLVSTPGMMMGMSSGDDDLSSSPQLALSAKPTGSFTTAESPSKVVAINLDQLHGGKYATQIAQSLKDGAAALKDIKGWLEGESSSSCPIKVVGSTDPQMLLKIAAALHAMAPKNISVSSSDSLLGDSSQKPYAIDVSGFSELIAGGGKASLQGYLKAHKVQGTVFSLAALYGGVQGCLKLYQLGSSFFGGGQTSPQ